MIRPAGFRSETFFHVAPPSVERSMPSPRDVTSVSKSKTPKLLNPFSSVFHVAPESSERRPISPLSCRTPNMRRALGSVQSTATKSKPRLLSLHEFHVLPPSGVQALLPSSWKKASRPPPDGSTLIAAPVSQRPPTFPPSTCSNVFPWSLLFQSPSPEMTM